MIKRLTSLFLVGLVTGVIFAHTMTVPTVSASKEKLLAKESMSLEDRYNNKFVNNVFKENILLTLSYLSGQVHTASDINWDKINQPSRYELTLLPGEVFAFHDEVLPEYKNASLITTHAHFSAVEGFLYDGDLYGDGVCHLASLFNWAARGAGLTVVAPTNHNFANIPDVPMQYGTAIYASPADYGTSALQNLYIKNTLNKPVHFVFEYADGKVTVLISKDL